MKFYVKEHDEKVDAITIPNSQEDDPYWFAHEAAKYFYQECDGWEVEWPLTFIVLKDSKEYEFEIDLDFEPTFYVMEKN
jgi:hypothetical protein